MIWILLVVLTRVMFDNVPDPPATNSVIANTYVICRVPPVVLSNVCSNHGAAPDIAYECLAPEFTEAQRNIPTHFIGQVADLSPPFFLAS